MATRACTSPLGAAYWRMRRSLEVVAAMNEEAQLKTWRKFQNEANKVTMATAAAAALDQNSKSRLLTSSLIIVSATWIRAFEQGISICPT